MYLTDKKDCFVCFPYTLAESTGAVSGESAQYQYKQNRGLDFQTAVFCYSGNISGIEIWSSNVTASSVVIFPLLSKSPSGFFSGNISGIEI